MPPKLRADSPSRAVYYRCFDCGLDGPSDWFVDVVDDRSDAAKRLGARVDTKRCRDCARKRKQKR